MQGGPRLIDGDLIRQQIGAILLASAINWGSAGGFTAWVMVSVPSTSKSASDADRPSSGRRALVVATANSRANRSCAR